MTTQTSPDLETKFSAGAWLTLLLALATLVFSVVDLAYRFTLPTDGWEISEATNLPGYIYTKNLMGIPSGLLPGDQVVAVNGIPADWQSIRRSAALQEAWQAGAVLRYTVLRGGAEITVPVPLGHWQLGKWLQAVLLDLGLLAVLLSELILLAVAAFVFSRRPGNPAAQAFLLIVAILVSSNLGGTLSSGFSASTDPTATALGDMSWLVFLSLFPYALIQFALVFPHPKPIYKRRPWLAILVGVVGFFLYIFASGNPISWFWFLISILAAVAILIHNAFTMRDAVSRAQMRWGLGGFLIGFGTLAVMFLGGTTGLLLNDGYFNLMYAFATTAMGSMLAVGITRYRLFDIDIIIRRTLVYTVLTALLVIVYFGLSIIMEGVLRSLVGGSGQVVTVISTLGVAALFSPLRRRVQDLIDRRFYRHKYDAEQSLLDFAESARSETDLEPLTTRVLDIVEKTLQPESVSLWLVEKQK